MAPSTDAEKAVAYAEMELEYRVQLFNRCASMCSEALRVAFVLLCAFASEETPQMREHSRCSFAGGYS